MPNLQNNTAHQHSRRTALLLQEVYQSALGTATEQFQELQQLFSQFSRINFHLNEDYDKVHEYLWFR